MNKVSFLILLFVNIALADFKTLNTQEVQKEIKNGTVLIDIRREDEWNNNGIIKNSHKLTFFDKQGKYDINQWMEQFTKIVKNKEQKFILVCARSNRTKIVGKFLSDKLKYKNVSELDGGIKDGWIKKGLTTAK